MTLSEFENTAFKPRMKAIYRSYTYRITACDFTEYLLKLTDDQMCLILLSESPIQVKSIKVF